jgi:hypothetical protein
MPANPLCSVSRLCDGILPLAGSILAIAVLLLALAEIRPALG